MHLRLIKYIFGLCVLACMHIANAQDIHFSQFYASPLTLNPAMTGMMDGQMRFAGNYREQWASLGDPYLTSAASFERNMALKNGDRPGFGLSMFSDKTGRDAGISTFKAHLSGAYNKLIQTSGEGTVVLGAGMQIGIANKSAFGDFTYPDQWVNGNYNANVATEEFNSNSPSYLDVNFGAIVNYVFGMGSSVFIGGSAFHLNRPKEIFIEGTVDNRLETRWVMHGGSRLVIGQGEVSMTPNFIMMFQNGARELNLGTSFSYDFGQVSALDLTFTLGGWYRMDDAIIAMAGIEFKEFQVGYSYDYNNSDLSVATSGRGAHEFSLRYIFKSRSINLSAFPGIRM